MFSKRSHRNGSKLSLSRTTVRTLAGSALPLAAGGRFTAPTDICTMTCTDKVTEGCPAGSTQCTTTDLCF